MAVFEGRCVGFVGGDEVFLDRCCHDAAVLKRTYRAKMSFCDREMRGLVNGRRSCQFGIAMLFVSYMNMFSFLLVRISIHECRSCPRFVSTSAP